MVRDHPGSVAVDIIHSHKERVVLRVRMINILIRTSEPLVENLLRLFGVEGFVVEGGRPLPRVSVLGDIML